MLLYLLHDSVQILDALSRPATPSSHCISVSSPGLMLLPSLLFVLASHLFRPPREVLDEPFVMLQVSAQGSFSPLSLARAHIPIHTLQIYPLYKYSEKFGPSFSRLPFCLLPCLLWNTQAIILQ